MVTSACDPSQRAWRGSRDRRCWSNAESFAHVAAPVPGPTLWRSRSLDRDPTLQQGHLGCLARVDREREPQRRIERDAKLVVAEIPNLIRFLAEAGTAARTSRDRHPASHAPVPRAS